MHELATNTSPEFIIEHLSLIINNKDWNLIYNFSFSLLLSLMCLSPTPMDQLEYKKAYVFSYPFSLCNVLCMQWFPIPPYSSAEGWDFLSPVEMINNFYHLSVEDNIFENFHSSENLLASSFKILNHIYKLYTEICHITILALQTRGNWLVNREACMMIAFPYFFFSFSFVPILRDNLSLNHSL